MYDTFIICGMLLLLFFHVIFFIKLKIMDDALCRYFDFELNRLREEKTRELQEISRYEKDDLIIILKKKHDQT